MAPFGSALHFSWRVKKFIRIRNQAKGCGNGVSVITVRDTLFIVDILDYQDRIIQRVLHFGAFCSQAVKKQGCKTCEHFACL